MQNAITHPPSIAMESMKGTSNAKHERRRAPERRWVCAVIVKVDVVGERTVGREFHHDQKSRGGAVPKKLDDVLVLHRREHEDFLGKGGESLLVVARAFHSLDGDGHSLVETGVEGSSEAVAERSLADDFLEAELAQVEDVRAVHLMAEINRRSLEEVLLLFVELCLGTLDEGSSDHFPAVGWD